MRRLVLSKPDFGSLSPKIKLVVFGSCIAIIIIALSFYLLFKPNLVRQYSDNSLEDSHKINEHRIDIDIDNNDNIIKDPYIYIDVGHGGKDPGAGKAPVIEKDIVLDISLKLKDELELRNISCFINREDDRDISLNERVEEANSLECSLFLSVHIDSYKNSQPNGVSTLYNPYSEVSAQYAEIMQNHIKNLGMRDRDIIPRSDLYVLRLTEMPAILLELGFISNPQDVKFLTNEDSVKKLVTAIADGIEEINSLK